MVSGEDEHQASGAGSGERQDLSNQEENYSRDGVSHPSTEKSKEDTDQP